MFLSSVEHLKASLCAETRAWCVAFGRNCNVKYRTEMEEIFTFIDDLTKRLSRPIKDLDDIRLAMGALKEIRDHEIRIDMSIGPIEVYIRFADINTIYNLVMATVNKKTMGFCADKQNEPITTTTSTESNQRTNQTQLRK